MFSAVRRARAWGVPLALACAAALVPAQAQATELMVEHFATPRYQAQRDWAFDAAGRMGARFARLIVEGGTDPGSFDWNRQYEGAGQRIESVRDFVTDAVAHEMKPYLTLSANGVPSSENFAYYCRQAALQNPEVMDFGVWNEPNLTGGNYLTPAQYRTLYRACYTELKFARPAAKVYIGELETYKNGDGVGACAYFNTVANSTAQPLESDGLAIHPYQFTTPPTTRLSDDGCHGIGNLAEWYLALRGARSQGRLVVRGGGEPTLNITEFGYCSERPAPPAGVSYDPNFSALAACPQNASGVAGASLSETQRSDWIQQAWALARQWDVALFDYHGVIQRDPGNFLGNERCPTSPRNDHRRADGSWVCHADDQPFVYAANPKAGYLWNSGLVRWLDGLQLPPVEAIRTAAGTVDPAASVSAATNVAASTATLSGTVDPKGWRTTYHFEYGPTTAYGNSTAEQTLAAESGPTPVSAVVSGLAQDTRYHWRLVVRSRTGSGEAVGASFRTRDDYGGSDVVVSQVFDSAGNLFATTHNPLYQQQTAVRFVDTTFPGPFGVGDAGSVRTAPTQAFDSDGTLYVVFQGANHTLQISSYSPDRRWFGPVQIGDGGSTYSTPAIGIAPDGTILVAVRGPDNRLVITVREADRITWHRPVDPFGTPNTTYSTPAVSFDRSGVFHVVAQGADHSLYLTRRQSGTWRLQTLSGSNTTYSQPGLAFSPTGALFILNRGPDDSLRVTERSPDERTLYGPYARGGVNTTFSSPSAAFDRYGVLYVVAQGPMNSMYVSSRMPDTTWTGPLQLAPSGTVFSAPSIAFSPQGTLFAAAQGPSNSMSFTTRLDDGTVNPPVVIGPQGTTGREP